MNKKIQEYQKASAKALGWKLKKIKYEEATHCYYQDDDKNPNRHHYVCKKSEWQPGIKVDQMLMVWELLKDWGCSIGINSHPNRIYEESKYYGFIDQFGKYDDLPLIAFMKVFMEFIKTK